MGKKIGIMVVVFMTAIGAAFFIAGVVQRMFDPNLWQAYFIAFAAVYTTFAGTDSWQKFGRSKYYRPEMDDKHPDVQAIAKENMKAKGESNLYE